MTFVINVFACRDIDLSHLGKQWKSTYNNKAISLTRTALFDALHHNNQFSILEIDNFNWRVCFHLIQICSSDLNFSSIIANRNIILIAVIS